MLNAMPQLKASKSLPNLHKFNTKCLETRERSVPNLCYMAPELKRGKCPTCTEWVTVFHPRWFDPIHNQYYHLDPKCIPEQNLEVLGTCGFCKEEVFTPLLHTIENGICYHGSDFNIHSCWRKHTMQCDKENQETSPA